MNIERPISPALVVTRPSVPDAEDYFTSRPVQRQPYQRATTDTFAQTMTAMRRGSPFNNNGPAVLELPLFSPSLPEPLISPTDTGVPGPLLRRRSTVMQAWQDMPQRQRAMVVRCTSVALIGMTALSAGFVFGLWVALNHLDLSKHQGRG